VRPSRFRELRKGLSILRAETVVALARLSIEVPENALVLDAGGPTTTIGLALGANAVSLNLNPKRRPSSIADLDAPWPIATESVDVIQSFYVLEHLYRPRRFFEESHRCLKARGVLLLTTVLNHPKHGSPHDYFRFTDDALERLAADAGFQSRIVPLLSGPLQSSVGALSPFLLFPLLRALALGIARGADGALKRLLPFVKDNWCAGYVLVALKR
jgi:SAM-dependent methyltransferase